MVDLTVLSFSAERGKVKLGETLKSLMDIDGMLQIVLVSSDLNKSQRNDQSAN